MGYKGIGRIADIRTHPARRWMLRIHRRRANSHFLIYAGRSSVTRKRPAGQDGVFSRLEPVTRQRRRSHQPARSPSSSAAGRSSVRAPVRAPRRRAVRSDAARSKWRRNALTKQPLRPATDSRLADSARCVGTEQASTDPRVCATSRRARGRAPRSASRSRPGPRSVEDHVVRMEVEVAAVASPSPSGAGQPRSVPRSRDSRSCSPASVGGVTRRSARAGARGRPASSAPRHALHHDVGRR